MKRPSVSYVPVLFERRDFDLEFADVGRHGLEADTGRAKLFLDGFDGFDDLSFLRVTSKKQGRLGIEPKYT